MKNQLQINSNERSKFFHLNNERHSERGRELKNQTQREWGRETTGDGERIGVERLRDMESELGQRDCGRWRVSFLQGQREWGRLEKRRPFFIKHNVWRFFFISNS